MIKKIILTLGLAFMLLPLQNTFAAESELLIPYVVRKTSYGQVDGSGLGVNDYQKLWDGNTTASVTQVDDNRAQYNNVTYIYTNTDINVTSISAYYSGGGSVNVFFYDKNRQEIGHTGNIPAGTRAVNFKNVRYVKLQNQYPGAINLFEFKVNGTYEIEYTELSNLTKVLNGNEVSLSWDIPDSPSFSGTNIYRNGKLITTVNSPNKSYLDKVDYGTINDYKVVALYKDGTETQGLTTKVVVNEPLELKDVKATPNYNRVDLSWKLPINESFSKVNIYRDTIEEQTAFNKFFIGEKVSAAATTKIFETNGTYFNDLTVVPETTYDYTLSITDSNGEEKAFEDLQVTTLEEPVPVITNPIFEKQPSGDYVLSWSNPKEGKVKILVGGKEFATVDAGEGSFSVPKENVKTDALGNPSITMIPIGEYGKEGKEVKAGNVLNSIDLPFNPTDLITSVSGLLWWIAPFVLLGLSFLLVPKLRNLIANAVRGKRGEKELTETERRTKSESPEKEKIESLQTEKEPRESKKDRVEKQGKKLRSVRVRERQIKEPKNRGGRVLKEPKISRIRQPRQSSNRTREAREGRQSERVQRMPREPRQGR